ncbi:MAG: hypothetical protein HYV07_32410 [Deltaproteobacteria bacterium]|nr:hypothetical protein [Deltaproteobacteria bacterium]
MSFQVQLEWLDIADPQLLDDFFTAKLSLWANGHCLTRVTLPGGGSRDHVIGDIDGLIEWVCDNLALFLWDIHCPFPREESGPRVPSSSHALAGWSDFQGSRAELGRWQHRHTFGHGGALALPSLVLVPDLEEVAIVAAPAPPELDGSVTFQLEEVPTEAIWVQRQDLRAALSTLVESTLERAGAFEARSELVRTWRSWFSDRWNTACAAEKDPMTRLRLAVGELPAKVWPALQAQLQENTPVLRDVLIDSKTVSGMAELDVMVKAIQDTEHAPRGRRWRRLLAPSHPKPQLPYSAGYALAREARKVLDFGKRPIPDLGAMLAGLDIELRSVQLRSSFRSAALSLEDGATAILLSTGDLRFDAVAPARFAIAAALGHLISDGRVGAFGAGHGGYSRWRATQKANAFAIELLLPGDQIGDRPTDDLAEDYGVSRKAVEWHRANTDRLTID